MKIGILILSIFILSCSDDSPTEVEKLIFGDVTLSSQADVNSFEGVYISGSLNITGAYIADLSPLITLTAIGADLRISNNDTLMSLDGLSSISSVGRMLIISDNSTLKNLVGLSSLTSIGLDMQIENNSALMNMVGLSSLTTVGSHDKVH